MSGELNVAAVLHPKPEKFQEVSSRQLLSFIPAFGDCSLSQVAALVTEVVKKVKEHEPDTLLYYAFQVKEKNEIVIIER